MTYRRWKLEQWLDKHDRSIGILIIVIFALALVMLLWPRGVG